ncbi:MAG: hypothetical protein K2Y37_12680 [Pirellulales bacterium]|nr:hypothetical protein [Pirellulales bacterium]
MPETRLEYFKIDSMKNGALAAIIAAFSLIATDCVIADDAQPSFGKSVAAPPLHHGGAAILKDHGAWDDAFALDAEDYLVLRRDDEWFSLSLTGQTELKKLATTPGANGSRIIAGAHANDRLWLFVQSATAAPRAIDAQTGKTVVFEIPGLTIPGTHAPVIQAFSIVPHRMAAFLMITGGDRETWPRDGNRPVYFWFDLNSANVIRFPIGCDLWYFSADQQIAVLGREHNDAEGLRIFQQCDVQTGEFLEKAPHVTDEAHFPFDWTEFTDNRPVHALYRSPTRLRQDLFAGLTVDGQVVRLDLKFPGTYYLSKAKERNGFVGLEFRSTGNYEAISPLWMMPFKRPEQVEKLEASVVDFAMLGDGNSLVVTAGHGRDGDSMEAFFHKRSDKSTWNLLEGIERLPPLSAEFAGVKSIDDRMTVRLIDSFGSHPQRSQVLCIASQFRHDRDSGPRLGKRLAFEKWQRALLVTSDGQRQLTSLFRETMLTTPGVLPEWLWLHDSGRIVVGNLIRDESGRPVRHPVQLSTIVHESTPE